MKGSYRISRLLKRFIHNGFGDTFLDPELSPPGREESDRFYTSHKRAPTLKSKDPLSTGEPGSEKQHYLDHQKEVGAGKVSGRKQVPASPGRILKLPLDDTGYSEE